MSGKTERRLNAAFTRLAADQERASDRRQIRKWMKRTKQTPVYQLFGYQTTALDRAKGIITNPRLHEWDLAVNTVIAQLKADLKAKL